MNQVLFRKVKLVFISRKKTKDTNNLFHKPHVLLKATQSLFDAFLNVIDNKLVILCDNLSDSPCRDIRVIRKEYEE
jgi:hypothetical protein